MKLEVSGLNEERMHVLQLAAPLGPQTFRDIRPYAGFRLSATILGTYSATLFAIALSVT